MIVSQTHIDELLATLKTFREQIDTLKARVSELLNTEMEAALTQAQKEYEARLKPLNDEASRLKNERAVLQMRLAQLTAISIAQPSGIGEQGPGGIVGPEPELPKEDNKPIAPSPPPVNPRSVRKRALADYIYSFLNQEQEEVVMQVVNAILADESKDMGDILEYLAWGDIWAIRTDWESLEEQHVRLTGWRAALEGRVNYWKAEVQRLESEARYALWEVKRQGEEKWQALLADLEQKQAAENARLVHEVVVLEKQLQDNTA